jgi:hypothetical protein
VVLALTADRRYVLDGVRPGTRLARVARRLRVGHGLRLGRDTWYLVPARGSRGVLDVHRGVVRQVGIADRSLAASPRRARRLIAAVR